MNIVTLYDIHGNLPALEAVLQEIEVVQPDLILVGGDIVSGPMPRETLERLLALGKKAQFIRGNADREVVTAFDGQPFGETLPEEARQNIAWTAKQLAREHRDFLANLPEQLTYVVDGVGEVLFCHATPRNDEEIFTPLTPQKRMQEIFAGVKQGIVVCGHTHVQFELQVGGVRVVNSGSVGMPYADPGAYWLSLGPEIEFRHTKYDLEQAAERIRASVYPLAQDFAENNVLKPATSKEALEFFEQLANR